MSRRSGDTGPQGISPSDVLAWSTLSGSRISPNEYEILTIMDATYLSCVHSQREEQRLMYKSQAEEKKARTL